MHVVHVVSGVWSHTGGPAEVIPKLCQNLASCGCSTTLLTLDGPHSSAAIECVRKGVDFRSYPVLGRFGIWYSPKLSRDLDKSARECDIIHSHGFWSHASWCARKYAQKHRKPLVICPQGVLSRDMFGGCYLKSVKKRIAWSICDRHSLIYASIIQAYSDAELRCMRHINGKDVAIVPNGVDTWKLPDADVFRSRFPQTRLKQILLFLSRIHPVKGVSDLLEAWATIHRRYPNWHLVLVGEGKREYTCAISKRIESLHLCSSATMVGPQYGSQRVETFAAADAFVLPSYGEGMSTSILEALMCGLPLVYTIPCRFPEAAERGAGLLGETGAKPLERNLTRLFEMSRASRMAMGEAGRRLAKEKYSWPKVARQMLSVYEWLLGVGDTPCCVRKSRGCT